MTRASVACICTGVFLAGVLAGRGVDLWPAHPSARAEGVATSASGRDYAELQVGRTPLTDSSELLARIARITTNSVVHIQSEKRTPRGRLVEETGSGVVVESAKARGFFVVSNRHVVVDTPLENISIHLHDGRVVRPARIWADEATDVAILKMGQTDLQAARWGDSDKVEIGHLVLAMGSPFGLSQSVTLGIISAKGRRSLKLGETREMLNQDFLQTDAAINPGNSGGPLIDMQGQIIGINTAIASNSGGNEGIGFSIPSNLVRQVIDQLLENGKVTRAYLGVRLDPAFNADAATKLKLDRVRGARVLEVYPNSPASRASLHTDDVVLTFDGVEVLDENHLINLVSLSPVGRKVKVVIFRDGRHLTVEVFVGDREKMPRAQLPASEPGMGTHVPQLGLKLHCIEPDVAAQLGFEPQTRGLLVLSVDRDCPLGSDLRLYDLIEEVGRTPVASVPELEAALASAEDRASILLTIKRRANNRTQHEVVVLRRDVAGAAGVE